MQANGVTIDNLVVSSYGESRAGNDADSDESLARNRRVDIVVKGFFWEGIGQLQDSLLANTKQRFSINTSEDQVIEGRHGGQFYINAGSFVDADGNVVEGNVDITLTECYDFASMMKLGLSTTASEAILETGGMLQLEAFANGQPLALAEGQSIMSAVPTPEFQQDMSLFLGQGHNDENQSMDWSDTGQQMQTNPFPLLTFAKAPNRPSRILEWTEEEIKINIEEKPEEPAPFKGPRIYKPRKPNPDRVVYRPKGLQRWFMSKAKKEENRQQIIAQKNAEHEENMERYEQRQEEAQVARARYKVRFDQYVQDSLRWMAKRDSLIQEYYKSEEYLAIKEKWDNIYEARLKKYRQDSTAYQEYRRQKIARYEAAFGDEMATSKAALDRYFFNINQLGWVNIDRFMKEDVQRTTLAVLDGAENAPKASVFFIVPDRNIILRMATSQEKMGKYYLKTVPQGERAKVIAFKVENNKAMLAQQEFVLGANMELELDFEPGRLRDIRSALEGVN